MADFNLASISGVATTALTLHPPENFNLAINGPNRQIKTTAKFSRYTVHTVHTGRVQCLMHEARLFRAHTGWWLVLTTSRQK